MAWAGDPVVAGEEFSGDTRLTVTVGDLLKSRTITLSSRPVARRRRTLRTGKCGASLRRSQ